MKYLLILCLVCVKLFTNAQSMTEKIMGLESSPNDFQSYQSLNLLLSQNYSSLSLQQRQNIRAFLKDRAQWSKITIISTSEKGEKIIVKGKILDKKNKGIKNAKIEVFQTDNLGYYAPTDAANNTMNESDARLWGIICTDSLGNFSLETIRPTHYPKKYNGRFIPAHIHFNVSAVGFNDQNIQMVFDDDITMKDNYWQDWAKKLHYPIVTLKTENKYLVGRNDFHLSRK